MHELDTKMGVNVFFSQIKAFLCFNCEFFCQENENDMFHSYLSSFDNSIPIASTDLKWYCWERGLNYETDGTKFKRKGQKHCKHILINYK